MNEKNEYTEPREIIFRGKRRNHVVLDESPWVCGSLLVDKSNTFSKYFIYPGAPTRMSCFVVDDETVGQFTGFTDKSGKRIFDGDILMSTDWNDIIILIFWDDKQCAFMMKSFNDDFHYSFNYHDADISEVIGNKWDNPELLKGAE